MNDTYHPPGPAAAEPYTPLNYKSATKPIWCPGCGDYTVLNAVTKALALVQRPPHEVAVVSGIGCSSRIPAYTSCYGFHGVHGRSLAAAQSTTAVQMSAGRSGSGPGRWKPAGSPGRRATPFR